jgi:hypothetical protein
MNQPRVGIDVHDRLVLFRVRAAKEHFERPFA